MQSSKHYKNKLSSRPPDNWHRHKVYTIGYPTWDGRHGDPSIVHRLFTNVYGIKRLQPGEIVGILEESHLLTHDCTTLNGNSGSCLIDIETHKVIGLHFKGHYRQTNYAVALWGLTADPLLKKAKLLFD